MHVAMFLVGRLFNGIGVDLMLELVPLYQCEIAPVEARGKMVASHGLLIVSGHVGELDIFITFMKFFSADYVEKALAAWTSYGCYFSANEAFQWRFELSAQAIWPLRLLFGMPWLPESPRWLMERGYHEDALAVLEKLRSEGTGLTAHEEFNQMAQQMALDKELQKKTGRFLLLTVPSYRKRLLFGCLTQFLCQSTGVLAVNNYQVMLYNGLGLYNSIPLLLYACYLTWAAFMNYFSAIMVDRVGRTKLLVFGLIGCSMAIICEMAMVAKFSGTSNQIGNGFGVFFLFLYVTIYGLCLDATCYVYCVEVFPTHVRAIGMGLSVFSQACATLIYMQAAPGAFGSVWWKYYFVFFIVPLIGVVYVWKTFPETKGATLEDIGKAFGDEATVDTVNQPGSDQESTSKHEVQHV